MRVGLNARTLTVDEPDGAVQVAREVSHRLAARDDVELTVYGSPRLRSEFDDSVSVRCAGFYSGSPFYGVVWERTILPMLVGPDDVDVLLCPNGNAPVTSVGCPIVTYVHDVNAQRGMSSGVHRLYRRILLPQGIRNSEAVVTVSEFSRSEIPSFLPVEPEDVHVVYNGLDDLYLNDHGAEPFELPDEYLLYVGAMNPRKNLDRLFDAFGETRGVIPHKLVLIGPKNKSVYKKIDVDTVSRDVITKGFVPKAELKYAYENASGLVYPSLYEGFGLPPLEAMACGTPVVASDRSAFPEILDGFGELVDPQDVGAIRDAMITVATEGVDGDEKRQMRQYARQFTWDQSIDELLGVLRQVVDRSARR